MFGNWIGYVMDGSNEKTINTLIKPVYKGLMEMGWEYFKVDALRHLRYEGYNSNDDFFRAKNKDPADSFRKLVASIREETGKDRFILGCWGIRPELIGIIDGCRIGDDGFGYAGFAQYNSFNNVVWRNDPDHIVLSQEEAYPSCMLTSMTGSVFMLTDKPGTYTGEIIDAAKRCLPVMFTRPGQIYDVDPSKFVHLSRTDTELNGTGPRIFDAAQNGSKDILYLLEIIKPFENWMLLGTTNMESRNVKLKDLGLPGGKEYLVFEFWTKQLLGSFMDSFHTGETDSRYNCQLFCIRERQNHPQLLATNRHISCGAYETESLKWDNMLLTGLAKAPVNEEYVLYLTEPSGYNFTKFDCTNATLVSNIRTGAVRIITMKPASDQDISW
ncbi:hypothetical protein EG832_16270, partial [bacterium]|nr:hypothetical protein [bacterium]